MRPCNSLVVGMAATTDRAQRHAVLLLGVFVQAAPFMAVMLVTNVSKPEPDLQQMKTLT